MPTLNGDPVTAVSPPVAASMLNTETRGAVSVPSRLLAMSSEPSALTVRPAGWLAPVGVVPSGVSCASSATENREMSSSPWFATYAKRPSGVNATPCGS